VIKYWLCLLAVIFPTVALAQLNGHNLRGDYGLTAGTLPPPGSYLSPFYVNYNVDALRDRNGDALGSGRGREIEVDAFSLIYQRVSDKQVFGGNYGFMVAPSWVNNSLGAPFLEGDFETSWGLGDLYIQPVVLGWNFERVDYTAGIGIFAPTGNYTDGANDNTGLGMWTFEVFGGTTLYLDSAKSWHLATTAFWETHSEKEDSDQKVGNILTLEGGLGKSFGDGVITVGLSYFAQWKLANDKLGDDGPADSQLNKHKVFGAGPELAFAIVRNQQLVAIIDLRYLTDFGAESMTEGDTITITATFPLGG
jgi:hypothetical protein